MTKVAFLYATFPRSTETFIRRELRELAKQGFHPRIYSIWRGAPSWESKQIFLFPTRHLLLLFIWLPYWAWRRPNEFRSLLTHLWATSCPSFQNWNETFLGLAFALVRANEFKKNGFERIHGVWATMPATAAYALHRLIDVPFSMGAHAYDVFRFNGDWLLSQKLRDSVMVRTSSESTGQRLKSLGVRDEQLSIIHRSLTHWPQRKFFPSSPGQALNILAVGRLVEKKGYFLMLQILSQLKFVNIPFRMEILGGGPLRNDLLAEIDRLGLSNEIRVVGHCLETEIQKKYLDSDILLYTGMVSSNGDRDGIPNVIPEALSSGMLVLASNKAGCSEAFVDGQSGFSLDPCKIEPWIDILSVFFSESRKIFVYPKSRNRTSKRKISFRRKL